ncbi:hypothetical protein U1Q18_023093 [Sarracenia purpurea var. burkii]
MAREFMHAWMKFQGTKFDGMEREVKEDICQLISHLWLEVFTLVGDEHSSALRYRSVRKIELHKSEEINAMYHQYGLKATLDGRTKVLLGLLVLLLSG